VGDRADVYKKLLRDVAKELGEATSAEIVKHVAALRMMRESLQTQILLGERINPNDLIALDAALSKYLPQRKPISVTVELVDSLPHEPPPTPPQPPTPPTPPPTDTEAKPATNVVQLPVPVRVAADPMSPMSVVAAGAPGGSIHDYSPQLGAPPLKRNQNAAWQSFVGPVGSQFGVSSPFSVAGEMNPQRSVSVKGGEPK
jgi:hypothetical protein